VVGYLRAELLFEGLERLIEAIENDMATTSNKRGTELNQ
jgi:FAD synthase